MVDVGEVRKGREPDEANMKTEEVGWREEGKGSGQAATRAARPDDALLASPRISANSPTAANRRPQILS